MKSIFPTFFVSGFECSTFLWRDQGRRNLVAETQHDRHVQADYDLLHDLGIAVAREGILWPFVDRKGEYDFSSVDPVIEAMNRTKIIPIWDLCHYGYPDDLDPFRDPDGFVKRFAKYCRAAAEYVVPRIRGPHFFTPINEINYFAFIGGEWGWVAPFGKTRKDREQLRQTLCQAAIAGVKAIRQVNPEARMVHIDPLVHVVTPHNRPDLEEKAHHETYVDTYLAWDILCGKEHPELGGSPEILDIVGVNNYSFGQMEYREEGPHAPLDPGDDRIVPVHDLITRVWQRYQHPMIIGETSGLEDGRDDWLRDIMHESLVFVQDGIEMHAICLFTTVDMPDWNTGEWLHNGICDLVDEADGNLRREPFQPYIQELRRWQKKLRRTTVVDEDPFSDPVDLQDVMDAANRITPKSYANWH